MTGYTEEQPTRAEVDALTGDAILIFGTGWCGYCRAAERHIDPALAEHPDAAVIRVEDGKGRPLGRSFGVKLWPTLIALQDGQEVGRVVRPTGRKAVDKALAPLAGTNAGDAASA